MGSKANFLALDLGAESGRGIIGSISDDKLELDVLHRFPNGPSRIRGSIYWDVLRLFDHMKYALSQSVKSGIDLSGIGIDTWGVDYALLGKSDVLLGNPYHYRDSRTNGMMEEVFKHISAEEIFETTGLQFMQFNTLYQLYAMSLEKSPLLELAEVILPIPNLFSFWFSGVKAAEFTHVSTSQCYDPRKKTWAFELMKKLGLPTNILPEIISPGTVLGPVLPDVAEETGAEDVPVIATASHDTASAVVAAPISGQNCAYISSGTWSLMGIETSEPIINENARMHNFTNEGGVEGTFRFLTNIMGLWLVQESRRTWAKEGEEFSYEGITRIAAAAEPFKSIIDTKDPSFLAPGDMPERICRFCASTGQRIPETKGEIARTALESLSLSYRQTIEALEELTGRSIDTINIVGGGCQNKLLCQFAADATGRKVVVGPIEATAAGNVLVQAMAVGLIGSLEEARQVIRNSFILEEFVPQDRTGWDEAYERFLTVSRS
ncbi:MAG: rhamnulokinase family protein [Armatimonadota bacterium]